MRSLAIFGALLSFLVISPAQAQVDLESLKHVDLRDLATNSTYLKATSRHLIELMMAQPARFTGPAVIGGLPDASAGTRVKFDETGARGPIGDVVTGEDGRARFKLNPEDDPKQIARTETRRYTIFSAEYHDIIEEVVDKRFVFKLVLFIHDPDNVNMSAVSRGYFFRVFTVVVDWSKADAGEEVVQIVSMDNEIPLTATRFQLVGDILDRKVILEDSVYGIKKVFPLGVGAFDIRAAIGMDGHVSSMTREFQSGSKMFKVPAVENHGSYMTRSRTYPSYYRGRPFFGIIAEDGNYKSIGMHYQIDDALVRGFVSHGCIRTRDSDLYQLDAILNEGGQEYLPVRYHLSVAGDYARWQSPVKKEDSFYDSVVYSARPSEESVKCKFDEFKVRRDSFNPNVHTVADGDCLTMTTEVHSPTSEVIEYMLGRSDVRPTGLFSPGRDHVPLAAARGECSATEGWKSDGGIEEVQRQRGELFGIFKSRKQRRREELARQQAELERALAENVCEQLHDEKAYPVPGDSENARMTPVQPVVLSALVPKIRMDLFAPKDQKPAKVEATTPTVVAPAITKPATNAKVTEEIKKAQKNVADVNGYIAEYCSPRSDIGDQQAPAADVKACRSVNPTCATYCDVWKFQFNFWSNELNKLKLQ